MPFYLKVLAFLATLGSKIPAAIEFLTLLHKLLVPVIENPATGGLAVIKPSAKMLALEEKIAKKLSPKGRLRVYDFSKLRALAKWASDSGLGAILFALLKSRFGL